MYRDGKEKGKVGDQDQLCGHMGNVVTYFRSRADSQEALHCSQCT